MKHLMLLLLAGMVVSALGEDVCYDDVGCFTTDYPYTDVRRPISNLPLSPDVIRTRFYLYTRNITERFEIAYNGSDFGDFAGDRKTMIIIHGFSDSGDSGWMKSLKDKILARWDYNVILVDWGLGAKSPYLQATANSQLVGRQVALLSQALVDKEDASVARMHLVAHSLGCQVCGYAGARIPGLARITGLDPAQPYFEDTALEVHLDATDAEYVDIVHTDGRDIIFIGIGFTKACGDVDFFPNNGKNQPGCGDFDTNIAGLFWDLERLDFSAINSLFGCSHARAHELFRATLSESSCPFVSFPCRNHEEYVSGECQKLKNAKIGRMGMDSVNFNLSGSYYLQTTSDTDSLCMHYVEVELDLSPDQLATRGNMIFRIYGSGGQTELIPGWSSGVSIPPLGPVRTMLHTPVNLGDITWVELTYYSQESAAKGSIPLRPAMLRLNRVDTQLKVKTLEMWGNEEFVTDKNTMSFHPLALANA